MRLPRSIGGRLALAAALLIALALAVASAGIGLTLRHFVRAQLDQRLDAQIATVATGLTSTGGELTLSNMLDAPPFDRPRSGWYWQASDGRRTLRSVSLSGEDLAVPSHTEDGLLDAVGLRPMKAEIEGPRGERVYGRAQNRFVDGVPVRIVATAPMRALTAPLWQALAPVAATIVLLGLALTGASILQLRLGLKPLKALASGVGAIRAGREARLPTEQPAELAPLVAELNRLLDQNEEGLARARKHAANLGHALNTPLASLALSLATGSGAEDRVRLDLVRRMQDRIRHHLGRARAAAVEGPARARTEVDAHLGDLIEALARIHAERRIAARRAGTAGLAIACEAQDFDEMAGNLLDNAFKWAESQVLVEVWAVGALVLVAIEDDGPGLADDERERALAPGQRLDESVPGTGFGLPIARELAELYGGGVRLEKAGLGGLRVVLTLPAAG